MQFVADIRAPARDAGSIYILSSKFHRFFLKNLDANEINTRILRIDGVAQEEAIPNYGNRLNYGPNLEQLYPVQHSTIEPKVPVANSKSHTYLDSFFSQVQQPYRFEPVGIINKASVNPFTTLNTGERPDAFNTIQARRPIKFGPTADGHLYNNINANFHDFNGLRIAKSVAYNTSVIH